MLTTCVFCVSFFGVDIPFHGRLSFFGDCVGRGAFNGVSLGFSSVFGRVSFPPPSMFLLSAFFLGAFSSFVFGFISCVTCAHSCLTRANVSCIDFYFLRLHLVSRLSSFVSDVCRAAVRLSQYFASGRSVFLLREFMRCGFRWFYMVFWD